jgi:DNA-binding protein YbaB
MTSGFESTLNEVMADIEKQRNALVTLQQGLNEVTGEARSARRQVSVTVDARGEIVELKFHGQGYRNLPPAELANIIVATIRDARAAAQASLWESIGDTIPGAAKMADLGAEDFDWSASLGEAMTLPQPLMDLLKAPPDIFRRAPTADESDATGDESTARRPAPGSGQH